MVNDVKSSGNRLTSALAAGVSSPGAGCFTQKAAQAKELSYAASKLTAIEINATYYGSQKPESFRKWAAGRRTASSSRSRPRAFHQPPGAVRGADFRQAVPISGVTELGDRLGPLLWQFAPTKKFDEADFRSFLELLPEKQDGLRLRHVVEVRLTVSSFRIDRADPQIQCRGRVLGARDLSGDRRLTGSSSISACRRARTRSRPAIRRKSSTRGPSGSQTSRPATCRRTSTRSIRRAPPKAKPRDVFAYVIHEGKVRAPAAAMELIERLRS